MAGKQPKPINWSVMIWAGLADMAIGIALAVSAVTGVLGDGDYTILVVVGGLLVITGVGLFLWGRNNLSKAGDRRGDLN